MGYLPDTVSEEPVSGDWMFQFFENCQDVTEAEMQRLWARILAGEVAQPKTFSRRTIELLKTFDSGDAKAFTDYCSVCFRSSAGAHLAFQAQTTLEASEQRCGGCQRHSVSLGLLDPENAWYEAHKLAGWVIEYFGTTYRLSAPPPPPMERYYPLIDNAKCQPPGTPLAAHKRPDGERNRSRVLRDPLPGVR